MSILDLSGEDFENVVEPEAVEAGEYELKILEVKMDTDKNDEPYIMPRFEVKGQPTAKDFTKFLRIPHAELDEKKLNNAKLQLKRFGAAFGIDFSGELDLDELQGLEGWALLGLDPGTDSEYGAQNFVKQFITGA
jgi:hypothetical protein